MSAAEELAKLTVLVTKKWAWCLSQFEEPPDDCPHALALFNDWCDKSGVEHAWIDDVGGEDLLRLCNSERRFRAVEVPWGPTPGCLLLVPGDLIA